MTHEVIALIRAPQVVVKMGPAMGLVAAEPTVLEQFVRIIVVMETMNSPTLIATTDRVFSRVQSVVAITSVKTALAVIPVATIAIVREQRVAPTALAL